MTWVAVGSAAVTVVAGAYSANQQKKGAQGAANAASAGSAAEIEERRRQFDLTRQDNAGYLEAGNDALQRQQSFLDGDMSGFQNSAGYKFAVDQGFQGLNRLAAANGSYRSGGADADRISFGQGLASQSADSYWNKLAGRAGQGQTAVNGLGQLGMGMANQNAYSMQNATNARMSSYGARADANSQMAGLFGNQVNSVWGNYSKQNGGGWGGV